MSDIIERLAQAMAADYNERHGCQHGFNDTFFPESVRDEWRATARVAINMMKNLAP